MNRKLEPIVAMYRQRRERSWQLFLVLIVIGLALTLVPDGQPRPDDFSLVLDRPLRSHLLFATGLTLTLVGFLKLRQVLRWPAPEEEFLVQLLTSRPEALEQVTLLGRPRAGSLYPLATLKLELRLYGAAESLQVKILARHRTEILSVIAELAPQARVIGP